METLQGFDFIPLAFDADGNLLSTSAASLNELKDRAKSATDAIFIAHGFRNSESEARTLYGNFLQSFRANMEQRPELASLKSRKFVVAGVFWPSKALPESPGDLKVGNVQSADSSAESRAEEKKVVRHELQDLHDHVAGPEQKAKLERAMELLDRLDHDPKSQDEFGSCLRTLLDQITLEKNEGLEKFTAKRGSEALKLLEAPVILPASAPKKNTGTVSSLDLDVGSGPKGTGQTQGLFDAVSSIFGAAGRFVNLTTWYLMKARSGKVGANGTAAAVRQTLASNASIRIHLVGHSLGGRLMAACAKSLDSGMVASLNLLEAAFSHYGFSQSPEGAKGFFCDVLNNHVVKGPIIATYSDKDEAVGLAYALSSRLARDNAKAIGDERDEYGGIGRNGTQLLDTAKRETLHQLGAQYTFAAGGVVTNLNGSGGLIKNHGDITNPLVTYAVASAIAST